MTAARVPSSTRFAVRSAVENALPMAVALSKELWDHPETAFEEHRAVAAVRDALDQRGHRSAAGSYGLPTALEAEAGDGDRWVTFLAEYDALPDLGHACGHNVIAAAAFAAYVGVVEGAGQVPGKVRLLGTPAEEGGGGKEILARNGAFDDTEAVLMVHPAGHNSTGLPWLGRQQLTITYQGEAEHAALKQFPRRNALDAAVHAYSALTRLRYRCLPAERIHGIIAQGGTSPNVIPHETQLNFYIRAATPERLEHLTELVIEEAYGAAVATDTTVEFDPGSLYLPVRSNPTLAQSFGSHLALSGRRLAAPLALRDVGPGSTDLGNVSVRVPAIHPTVALAPPQVALHTREFTAWSASPAAGAAIRDSAMALAQTALDVLLDSDFRSRVHADFQRAGGVLDVPSMHTRQQAIASKPRAHVASPPPADSSAGDPAR